MLKDLIAKRKAENKRLKQLQEIQRQRTIKRVLQKRKVAAEKSLMPAGSGGDSHYLDRSYTTHIIDKHIKEGELTAREYEYIPRVLLSENVKFQTSNKNGRPHKLKYREKINGVKYILIEAIATKMCRSTF